MGREQKLLLLHGKFKELGIDQQIDYNKFYLYSIITHSTAIEGSTVTEIENQLLFDDGISVKGRSITEQLMNLDLKIAYEKAIIFAKRRDDISVEMLKYLSSLVLKNTGTTYNTILGEFSTSKEDLRLLNVTAGAGGYSYMNYSKVPNELEKLCVLINSRRKNLSLDNIIEAYKLSFDAHFYLVSIHPWADGNGRMARLLMNFLQFEFGLIPTNINKDRKAKYIESLIATRKEDNIDIFRNFMFDEHIRNIENTIKKYESSIDSNNLDIVQDVGINVGINENRVLEEIRKNNQITAKDIAKLLSISVRQTERIFASLKKKKIITRIGSNKSGFWNIIDD